MKIDLLDIFNKNKELNQARDELILRKELRVLLSTIIRGDDEFFTNSENLIKRIGLTYKKNECSSFLVPFDKSRLNANYMIKLSRANIKRVQSYLDNLEEGL